VRINKFIGLMALIVLLGSAQGITWIVTEGGSIQATIDSAGPGDVIMVERGTYENVNVTKPLTLRGDGYPVVDGAGNGSAVTLYADGILLEGFVATNYSKSPQEDAGIKVLSHNNIIDNNIIYNGGAGAGILLNGSNDNFIAANNITDDEFGIYILSSNGNNITDNIATKNGHGILLSNSRNNTIVENNASFNTGKGIGLEGSTNNTLKRNLMSGNGYNFDADGENEIDASNLVDGKAVYYLVGAVDITIDSSSYAAGIVRCLDSSNITIKDQNFDEIDSGIRFYNTTYSCIENNTFKSMVGIEFISSKNNTVMGNNFSDGSEAIVLIEAYWNTIADNAITNNKNGVRLHDSGYNEITRNSISNGGDYGIQLIRSSNNTVNDNNISFRLGIDGIYLLDADGNMISNNSIRNNLNGIHLARSCNNTLVENNASENSGYPEDNGHGIFITDKSEGNIIKANNVYNNSKNGIFIDNSNINIISDNIAYHNDERGIIIKKSDDNIITNNSVRYNKKSGIIVLERSSGNEISDNNASNNKYYGFIIENSIENIVTNNSASNNTESGIMLKLGSSGNIISDNKASNNKYGFLIEGSTENIVDNNSASNNYRGMILDNSWTITISNNSLHDNRVNGLSLEDSYNNTLADNSASNNTGCGITLLNSENNNLTNNSAYNNSGGIALKGSSYNEISSNIASKNQIGIYLSESDKNELKDNYVADNEVDLAINSSENNTMDYNLMGTVAYGMIINTDIIIDRDLWEKQVLSTDIERYLQSYEEVVMTALPGTESGASGYIRESAETGVSGETEESGVSAGKSKSKGHGVGSVETSGTAASPPSPSIEDNQEFAEEASGWVVWDPPEFMVRNVREDIYARIGEDKVELSEGLKDVIDKGIDFEYNLTYRIKLDYDNSAFDVSTNTLEEQYITKKHKKGEWIWHVTPKKEGNHTLTLLTYVNTGNGAENMLCEPCTVTVLVEDPMTYIKNKLSELDMKFILSFGIGTLLISSGLLKWLFSMIKNKRRRNT